MDAAIPGFYAFAPEVLPFSPDLSIRTFLLQREESNLLIYGSSPIATEAQAVENLGGAFRHYLNHRHEAAFGCDKAAQALRVPLYVHENERQAVAAKCEVDGTFSERHRLGNDFEIIPTPGHTSGATAYLWDSGQHRLLFTGDTLYFGKDGWIAALLGSSNREQYINSLELMRELDFDVLVPWAAPVGQPFHALTTKADYQQCIGAVINRLRAGEDH